MFTVSYGCNKFRQEPRLAIQLLSVLFVGGIKISIPETIYSELREAILEALFLKKAESVETILISFGLLVDCPMNWYI